MFRNYCWEYIYRSCICSIFLQFLAFVIAKFLDLHFQGHEFWNVIISKRWELAKNAQVWLTFIEVGICHRVEPLRILYSWPWPWPTFQGHKFETLVSRKRRELLQNVLYDFTEVDIRHRMAPLRMLYSVTLTFIFKIQHLVMLLLLKNNYAGSGCPRKNCIDSHGPCRVANIVMI